jgi:2-deoxy-D-gluconate 3-dehydrogenase
MPTSSILDLFRLDGKVALVTGAASGLGALIAITLAQARAQVAVIGNRRAADETATTIGRNAVAFQADLSSTEGAEILLSAARKHFGRIDILINNAGTITRAAAEDTTLEERPRVLQVNLTSVFQFLQLVARDIFARKPNVCPSRPPARSSTLLPC